MENDFENMQEDNVIEKETQDAESVAYDYGQAAQSEGTEQPQSESQTDNSEQKSYQQQYQDNFDYNVGNQANYTEKYSEMDDSPLSMSDWVLTILAWMIPCFGGIIIYCVWAFGKNGNVHRRNFCRAYLAVQGVLLVLSIILVIVIAVVVGASTVGSTMVY